MAARLAILDTSDRQGFVSLAEGPRLLGTRVLEEARRHTRDLAPALSDLLDGAGWRARDLDAIIVSRGPGSYTGLRVGIMSAKMLSYAAGCQLIGIDTFVALAHPFSKPVEVIADAQQNKLYRQLFSPTGPLEVVTLDAWLPTLSPDRIVIGPGLEQFEAKMPPSIPRGDRTTWRVTPGNLLALGVTRFEAGEADDLFTLEPLYLRPSSAEENWKGP